MGRPRKETPEAYRKIRSRIFARTFPPGHRLNVADLKTMLHLGIAAIRAALSQLVGEGLVVVDRYGYVVRQVGVRELHVLLAIRLVMETLAVCEVARAPNKDRVKAVARLLELHQRMQRMQHDTEQYAHFISEDIEFHAIIAQSGGYAAAAELLKNMHHRILLATPEINVSERMPQIVREHQAIINAIQSGFAKRAATAVRDNLFGYRANSWRTIRAVLSGLQHLIIIAKPKIKRGRKTSLRQSRSARKHPS